MSKRPPGVDIADAMLRQPDPGRFLPRADREKSDVHNSIKEPRR